MKKSQIIIIIIFSILGIALMAGLLSPLLFSLIVKFHIDEPGVRVEGVLELGGLLLFFVALLIAFIFFHKPRNSKRLLEFDSGNRSRFRNWLEKKLGKWVDFGDNHSKPLGFKYTDLIIFVIIIFVSASFTLVQFQSNYPYPPLDSDAATIASFQAAQDFPNNFKGDFLLGNAKNFASYYSVLMPITHWLYGIAGNYPLAMMMIYGPVVFLYLLGFYLLGLVIFKNRWWSIFFCILTAIPILIAHIENSGLMNDPLPRFIFQALLPYVLIMIWVWRDQPGKWIFPTIAMGLMVYVHPVSAPSWIAGLFLGFLFLLPREWSAKKKLGMMLLLSIIILVLVVPFAVYYFMNRTILASGNYDIITWVVNTIFPTQASNPQAAFGDFLIQMTQIIVLPLAVIGSFFMWLYAEERRLIKLISAWSVGILSVSLLIPFFERNIESIFHLTPIEFQLVRGLKNLVPIFCLLAVGFLNFLFRRLKKIHLKMVPSLLGVILFVLFFSARANYTPNFVPLLNCIKTGRLVCGNMSDLDKLEVYVKDEIPQGGRIFFSRDAYDNDSFSIRYIALHPLVYSWKDKLVFDLAPDRLDEWYLMYQTMDQEGNTTDWYQRDPAGFIKFVKGLGAQYIVLEKPKSTDTLNIPASQIIYQNSTYILFQVME